MDPPKRTMVFTIRRLQQYALAISILSVVYNGAEGVISIVFESNPSPSKATLEDLANELQWDMARLRGWFANKRRRVQ